MSYLRFMKLDLYNVVIYQMVVERKIIPISIHNGLLLIILTIYIYYYNVKSLRIYQ